MSERHSGSLPGSRRPTDSAIHRSRQPPDDVARLQAALLSSPAHIPLRAPFSLFTGAVERLRYSRVCPSKSEPLSSTARPQLISLAPRSASGRHLATVSAVERMIERLARTRRPGREPGISSGRPDESVLCSSGLESVTSILSSSTGWDLDLPCRRRVSSILASEDSAF